MPDPDEPDPRADADALIQRQREEFAALLKGLQVQAEEVAAFREKMSRMAGGLTPQVHRYGVFQNPVTRQAIVLRDVSELNGKPPIQTMSSFAEAIQFVNQRISDVVKPDALRPPAPPPPPSSP